MQAREQICFLEEYLQLEKSSDEKFEFWNGIIRLMSGASFNHNVIVQNLNIEIGWSTTIYRKPSN